MTIDLVDEVLGRYYGPGGSAIDSYQRISFDDVERLLSDDTERRLRRGRTAALVWGRAELHEAVAVTAERLLITHDGVMYVAGLRATGPRAGAGVPTHLRYFGVPRSLLDSIVDSVGDGPLPPETVAAVDCRIDPDLMFPWPLDTRLRRLLDVDVRVVREPAGPRP